MAKEKGMQDAWRAYLEMALGLTETSRKKAQKVAKRLVGRGGATAAQVQALAEDMVSNSSATREAVTKIVRAEVDKALGHLGLANSDEVERLSTRVRELENQLADARAAAGAPSAPVAEGSGPPVGAEALVAGAGAGAGAPAGKVAKKAVAKKAVAKKAAAPASGPATGAIGGPEAVGGAEAEARIEAAGETTAAPPAEDVAAAARAVGEAATKAAPAKKAVAKKAAPTKAAPTKAAKAPAKAAAKKAPAKKAPAKKAAPGGAGDGAGDGSGAA